jgi:phosphomethylpyrimidine synthase
MNANEKFIAADAHVDEAAIQPLPNSRKIYVCRQSAGHSRADAGDCQADTDTAFGGEKNPPIYVYDCSGPYSDPQASNRHPQGLPALRAQWIAERSDSEPLASSQFGFRAQSRRRRDAR